MEEVKVHACGRWRQKVPLISPSSPTPFKMMKKTFFPLVRNIQIVP